MGADMSAGSFGLREETLNAAVTIAGETLGKAAAISQGRQGVFDLAEVEHALELLEAAKAVLENWKDERDAKVR